MTIEITTPLTHKDARNLHCGDTVLLSGIIYTARDAAHKRLCELIREGKELPINLFEEIIYYVGPTPTPPGRAIGSAGPTTSYRMDAYAPALLDLGLTGMIGKGARSAAVIASMQLNGAVYFGAIGGAGALLSSCVEKAEIIAYEDLGAEAIHRLTLKNMPVTVIIDSFGESLYQKGRQAYLAQRDKSAD